MAKTITPGDTPEIPSEIPVPQKMPEITPVIVPENEPIPAEEPEIFPQEEPFEPDIPSEIPPSEQ